MREALIAFFDETPSEMPPLWARMPAEPMPAYRAFWIWRSLPPDRRSIAAVEEIMVQRGLLPEQNSEKNRKLIRRWSRNYAWLKRTADFDAYVADREHRIEASLILAGVRHRMRLREQYRAKLLDLANQLIGNANEILRWPLRDGMSTTAKTHAALLARTAADLVDRAFADLETLQISDDEVQMTRERVMRMIDDIRVRIAADGSVNGSNGHACPSLLPAADGGAQ